MQIVQERDALRRASENLEKRVHDLLRRMEALELRLTERGEELNVVKSGWEQAKGRVKELEAVVTSWEQTQATSTQIADARGGQKRGTPRGNSGGENHLSDDIAVSDELIELRRAVKDHAQEVSELQSQRKKAQKRAEDAIGELAAVRMTFMQKQVRACVP